jgi:hypothetical protein
MSSHWRSSSSTRRSATYPDVFAGTGSAEHEANDRLALEEDRLKLAADHLVADSTTSDRKYNYGPISIAQLFGAMPTHWYLFITHNSGVNSNSAAWKCSLQMDPNGITGDVVG